MEKSVSKLANQLQEARTRNLEQIEKSALRAHGKLWGMDVFSWYNPMTFEIENILHSFPTPVLWFGNAEDISKLAGDNKDCFSNLKMICCHDKADLSLSFEAMNLIETFFAANELGDVLKMLKTFKKENGILLFTSKGENWKQDKIAFESFLDIHQTK
jgi:hypothetical protein